MKEKTNISLQAEYQMAEQKTLELNIALEALTQDFDAQVHSMEDKSQKLQQDALNMREQCLLLHKDVDGMIKDQEMISRKLQVCQEQHRKYTYIYKRILCIS